MAGKGATEINFEERRKIRLFLDDGSRTGRIAEILGRSHSAIKQEILRGGGKEKYCPEKCQREYEERREAKKLRLRKGLTEKEVDDIQKCIEEGLSQNKICEKTGVSFYRIREYFKRNAIAYKPKHFTGLEGRIVALEFQVEILIDKIKELCEQN